MLDYPYLKAKAMFETEVDWRSDYRDASNEDLSAAYKFVVNIWNNYSEMVPDEKTIMALFKRFFPYSKQCRKYRPLGNFKDLDTDGMTRQDIYETWVRKFTFVRNDGKVGNVSMLDVAVAQVKKIQKEMLDVTLTRETIEACFAMMFYNTSDGVYQEILISRLLTERYKNSKKYFYKAAPSSMEASGVDGLFYHRSTGKIAHKISIKVYGAFSEKSLRKWRKKKKEPDYFVGYHNRGDTEPIFLKASNFD